MLQHRLSFSASGAAKVRDCNEYDPRQENQGIGSDHVAIRRFQIKEKRTKGVYGDKNGGNGSTDTYKQPFGIGLGYLARTENNNANY